MCHPVLPHGRLPASGGAALRAALPGPRTHRPPAVSGCSRLLLAALLAAASTLAAAEPPSPTGWWIQAATRADVPPDPARWAALTRIEGPLALVARKPFAALPGWDRTPGELGQVWYRHRFAVPAAWAGRSLWLDCALVEGQGVVAVDGRRAGTIGRLRPRCDLTAALAPGREATVDIFLARDPAAAGLAGEPDPLLAQVAAWARRAPTALGLVGEPRLVARGLPGWIEGLALATRHGQERLEAEVVLGGECAGLSVALRVEGASDPAEAAVAIAQAPATAGAVALAGRFAGRPWRLEDPWLYQAVAELRRADGTPVDRLVQRFGVREVVVAGREVRLNGRRTPWRMMGPITWSPVTGWPTADTWRPDGEIGRFWSALGVDLWQIQPNGDLWWQNLGRGGGNPTWQVVDDAMLARCDEAGIGVTLPVPPPATNQGLALPLDRDPALAEAYRADLAAWLARYRHHPCIQAYTVGMNLLDTRTYMRNISAQGMGLRHDGPDVHRPVRDAVAAAVAMLHRLDPTVPAYVHAGGWWGGDLHGANQHMNLLPLAEYERWPERWARQGVAPWVGDEAGTPYLGDFLLRRYKASGVGFDAKDPEIVVTETCAELLGDQAYALEPEVYRRDPRAGIGHLEQYGTTHLLAPARHARLPALEQVMGDYYARTLRSWRAWGVQGQVPWLMEWSYAWQKPSPEDRLARAYAGSNQRFCAFIGGSPELWRRERHLAAGEELRRSLVALYDGPRAACRAALRWRVEDGAGRTLAEGRAEAEIPAGGRRDSGLRAALPAVARRTEARLVLEAEGDGIAQVDAQPLVLWPPAPAPAPVRVRWHDPAGTGRAALGALAAADPAAPLLAVAGGALAGAAALPFTAAEVEAGLQVLVLAQRPDDLFRLGLRCEERGFRQAFVREPEALAGIADGDLADWRGEAALLPGEAEPGYWPHRLVMPGTKAQRPARCGNHGTVVSAAIETPQKGAFRPLVECGFDLAYSAVLEWRHGRGRVVFCQLDLEGRVGADPAATRVAAALLAHLARPGAPADRVLAVAGGGADGAALAALGFARGAGPGALTAAPLGAATPAALRFAERGAAPAPGWDAAPALTAGRAPAAAGGAALAPGLLRFRLPLAAQLRDGALVAVHDGALGIGVPPTAADGGERSRARLTAQRLRALYQRALTGLGARSDAAVAARLTTLDEPPRLPGGGPPLLALTGIEATEPATYAGLTGKALLDAPDGAAPPRWQDYARLLASRDEAGYGGVVGGTIDLAHAFRCRPSTDRRAQVRARFRLDAPARVNLYLGADYWARAWVDGRPAADLSAQQGAPRRVGAVAALDLAAGEHEVLVRVVGGSGGFSCSLAADTAAQPRGEADFMPDIARYGRWMRPYNPPGGEALYLAPRGDDDDPYLYYLW